MSHQKLYITLLTLLILTPICFASPTLVDYGQLPNTSKMAVSPSGEKIAFRKSGDSKDNLVIYSFDTKKIELAIDVSSVNPRSIEFISEDRLIFHVEEHKSMVRFGFNQGDSISAAYLLDLNKGSLEQLLKPGDNIYTSQSDVGRIIGISKNKKHIYMPAYIDSKRDHAAIATFGLAGTLNLTVMKVDLSSPNRPNKLFKGNVNAIDYFMGAKGDILVQERYDQRTNHHQILVKKGKKWSTIYDEKVELRRITPVGLTPDYKSLAILKYGDKEDRLNYFTMSLADGSISDPGVNRDDADIDEVITDINRIVHGVQYSGFLPSYKLFDREKSKTLNGIIKTFPGNAVIPVSWTTEWNKLLVLVAGSNYAGEYYLFDQALKSRFIGASYTNISSSDVHPIATVTLSAQDGVKIPMLLTIPQTKVSSIKNLPTVVLPHGGPQSYDQIGFDWLAQAIANEGYLVVQPQFRGSSGFGWNHYAAGFGEWGGKMQSDLNDSLDFLIAKGMVNKDKVCIVGASYGGYSALAAAAFTPKRYQCITSINGISDLYGLLAEETQQSGKYSEAVTYLKRFISKGEPDKIQLKELSPYYSADTITAPILLIHAENDLIVDIEQSKKLALLLKKKEKNVTYIQLPNENHWLEGEDTRLLTLKSTIEFINKSLH